MSRVTIITLSVLLLVGLVVAVMTIGVLNYVHDVEKKPTTTSTKAVEDMCQPTDYKEACFKSLSKVNSDDPKELVKAAFESTITEISEVASKSIVLQELEKDPKTATAVKDCKELFQDAIDDLQRSFSEMGEFDLDKIDKMLENLKIWLSATITYQETCLDGFDNTTGDAGEKVRKILELSRQMSSNGLAIVSEMSNLLGTLDISSFTRRRLLADDRLVVGHHRDNSINSYWQKHRRLLSSADNMVDNTLLKDDEPDLRRRRLLSSVGQVEGHDGDYMPVWLESRRRKLLQATNLAADLKGKANVIVAQDGSGNYKTIQEAINVIPKYGNESFIVYIKEGVYKEYLTVFKWMTHVVFVGDGPTKTRITNNQNFADGVKTFKTATLSVLGDYFMGKDIGIENSAGAIKHQAVALRVQSDKSIFYNCHMDGYQDTLYTHTYRQFYRDCRVTGTIDFIFGDAAAFFQNCTFVVRKPLENQRCIVTAQGRKERHQPTGIIIHRCRFVADPDYYPVRKTNTAYLGRPWKEFSKTIIMESYIDDSISPDGWLPWEGTFALDTCYYGEFNNVGPGCDMSKRVKWRGIKTIVYDRAEKLMPPQLYGNDYWIRDSGVPYDPNLSAFAPGPEGNFGEEANAPEGAALDISTNPYGSSSGISSTTSSSSQASSGGHSSSSSSSSGSSSSGSTTSQGSSSSVGQGSNNNGASQSTTTGSGRGSTGTSSSSNPSTGGGSIGQGSTGSSSTAATYTDISSTTTPLTNVGGSTGSSSTTTPSTNNGGSIAGGSTGGDSTGSTFTTTPYTNTGGSIQGGSVGSSSSTTVEGSSTGGPTTIPRIDAPTPSPVSIEETIPTDAPTPKIALLATPAPPTTAISQIETIPPVASETKDPITQSPTSSSSPKQTGPITVRELERMLMTNEEMEGEDEANDDMSGNVPDGDEPSPAMAVRSPTEAPTPCIVVSPIVSPTGPSPSPSEPGVEPADKIPSTVSPPPKANNARSNSKIYELHVILSGMLIWVALAM